MGQRKDAAGKPQAETQHEQTGAANHEDARPPKFGHYTPEESGPEARRTGGSPEDPGESGTGRGDTIPPGRDSKDSGELSPGKPKAGPAVPGPKEGSR